MEGTYTEGTYTEGTCIRRGSAPNGGTYPRMIEHTHRETYTTETYIWRGMHTHGGTYTRRDRPKWAGEKEQNKERWSGSEEMTGRGKNCLGSKPEKARPKREKTPQMSRIQHGKTAQKSLQLDWGLVWLPRAPSLLLVVWLDGSRGRAVAVAGWQGSRDATSAICQRTARDILQSQVHPHFSFLFSFLPYLADSDMQRFSLQFAVFRGFPTHPLHIPSRIDRGELPGVAVQVPAPSSSTGMLAGRRHWVVSQPSSTGMFAGRRHLAACLLQRRDTGKPYRVDRSNTRRSGCCTLVSK